MLFSIHLLFKFAFFPIVAVKSGKFSDVTINELNALGNHWTIKANERLQQQQNAKVLCQ